MSLASFTQQVGHRVKQDRPPESHSWHNWINPNVQSESYAVWPPVDMEYSFKPAPFQGDRTSPYNYTRTIRKVVSHSNYVRHEVWQDWPGHNDTWSHSLLALGHGRGLKDHALGLGEEANNLFDMSITQALNKLQSHKIEMGANLGQAKQTIDTFSDLASRFARFLAAMKRRNLREAANALAGFRGNRFNLKDSQMSLADAWLKWQYGIRPIMSDLHTLQPLIHDILNRELMISAQATVNGSRQRTEKVHEIEWLTKRLSTKMSFRTVVRARVVNPYAFRLDSAGLANPLSIAWELVPWSFAIDWFVPVGATLNALSATVGLESMGGWTTVKTLHTNSLSMDTFFRWGFGRYYQCSNGGNLQTAAFSLDRYARAEFPMPRLYANPRPYSTTRALNALALVRQLLKG